MSDSDSVGMGHHRIPVLTHDNFADWEVAVMSALTNSSDHMRVIEQRADGRGRMTNPTRPTDLTEASWWDASECEALGIIMSTASKLHREIILKHRADREPVYKLWTKICSLHQSRDASLRHQAWMEFFTARKTSDESYSAYMARKEGLCARISRLTPSNQTPTERYAELTLFAMLFGLPYEDNLRQSLTARPDLTLQMASEACVRVDTDIRLHQADTESANAARGSNCWKCDLPGHIVTDCPHTGAIKDLVTKHNASYRKKKHRKKSHASQTTSPSPAATANAATPMPDASLTESAGVATPFLSSVSPVTDDWLCDTGASCLMTGCRSAFFELKGDRRPVRLADGMVIYLEGLGSISFLSTYGYRIIRILRDVLYVPRLTTSLFSSNKFAKDYRQTYRELLEFPTRKWINRRTEATELRATIRPNNLAYMDWQVEPHTEAACVSLEELHTRLNHMPFGALRRLMKEGSLDGVPDRVDNSWASERFCEDCVSGKLTRAPHTVPVACADVPLFRVYTDVHGLLPTKSRRGNIYWVSFIDDFSQFPAVYFISRKSDVFTVFKRYKVWAENVTGRKLQILRDDKGGEYSSGEFDRFLADAGVQREHSIRDTPQQLGVAEQLNRTLDEGITTLLSQSGLSRVWWEDAASHFLYGKMRLPLSVTAPESLFSLFYGKKGSVGRLRPFGCLAYVHRQKDQRSAFESHAVQCVLIGYPVDYKGWRFWDPKTKSEIISDSAVFRESVFPFRKPSLSAIDKRTDPAPLIVPDADPPASVLFHRPLDLPAADAVPLGDLAPPLPAPIPPPAVPEPPAVLPEPASPRLVPVVRLPTPPVDLPERPRTPAEVRPLLLNYEHHPSADPLPAKRPSRARVPGALVEDAGASAESDVCIPLLDAIECVFSTSADLEPRSLRDALTRADGAKWVEAAMKEIEAHVENGTWELAQLPPGKRAIGSRWIFKVKRTPEGLIDKYKARLVAQGFSQIPGVHYGEVFASTARFAAVRTVIALAASEDLELESVDISTAFLNGVIDKEIYMKIPDGFEVEGELRDGEDPKRWVVRLLKGLYGIKQGPRLWALKLHSVLSSIGFQRIDCDYSVYVYRRGDVKIFLPIHVDDLLLASNSSTAIQKVKTDLSAHFTIHDLGPVKSILGIRIERDRAARSISLSQPGYIQSILDDFNMHDCNPVSTPMEENIKLSVRMCPVDAEKKAQMAKVPYRELIGKLIYLAVATRPDISYAIGVLCRFVENPGPEHWGAAKRVLRYLKGSVGLKLVYSHSSCDDRFTTYSDADLSGNPDNSRSTGGFAILIGGGAVQWGSRLQPHVSLSSTESEYTVASKVACEIMWMRYLFEEIGYDMARPSPLLVDNRSALQVAKHPEHQSTMKHVHRAYHWIRDHVSRGLITVSHVPGDLNLADIFTKPLGRLKFMRFRDMLGLRA